MESASGTTEFEVQKFEGRGIAMGMHNTDASVRSFARACFTYALETNQDLWFGAKDTILKVYDGEFKDIFDDIYANEGYAEKFAQAKLRYEYNADRRRRGKGDAQRRRLHLGRARTTTAM